MTNHRYNDDFTINQVGAAYKHRIKRCINSTVEAIFYWNYIHIRDKKIKTPMTNPEGIRNGGRCV